MVQLTEEQETTLRAEHGRIVRVNIGDQTLVFRRLKRAELVAFLKRGAKSPELAVEHCVGLCRSVLVWPEDGGKTFDALADEFPLAFAGQNNDGVVDALVGMARGDVSIEAK